MPVMEPTPPQISGDQEQDTNSDATVIYDPPVPSASTPKRIFATVTKGIKIIKHVRMYSCPSCGIKKPVCTQ